MKKLAIFVEGQTEQIFVDKLLTEIAGEKNIFISQQKYITQLNGKRSLTEISASSRMPGQKYYVLIRDCEGDVTVKSEILDACNGLSAKGYQKILGLRDVFPISLSQVAKLEAGLRGGLEGTSIPISIMLAVMEIEAWFLAETSHFTRIDPALTLDFIRERLSFDPSTENVEARPHPSKDLDDIYKLVRKSYKKKKATVQWTVELLDYSALYFVLRERVARLKQFIDEINVFLS